MLLFTPARIGPLHLKNRIVALPIYSGYAHPGGSVSPLLVEYYQRLAESGAALVVVANAAVAEDGILSVHNLRADQDRFISGLSRVARVIREAGALSCLQLNHGGRFAKTEHPLIPSVVNGSNLAFNIASLKDFMNFFPFEQRFALTRNFLNLAANWRQAMTIEQTQKVVTQFGQAARRAVEAGFDLVEIHGANGYLLCQWLSAFTNHSAQALRKPLIERAAIPLAVVREIIAQVPAGYPVGFRLILREWVPEGVDFDEARAFAVMLEEQGIDYLSASVGTYNSIFSRPVLKAMAHRAYLADDMRALKRVVSLPAIISGRIVLPAQAETILAQGAADLVGLGRPLRADEQWVRKAGGGHGKIQVCINCNQCLKRVVMDLGFQCQRWSEIRKQRTSLHHRLLSRNTQGLWVVADAEDEVLFTTALPDLLPCSTTLQTHIAPKLLYLSSNEDTTAVSPQGETFIAWSRALLAEKGFAPANLMVVRRKVEADAPDQAVRAEMVVGQHGVIVLGRRRSQPWQARLLYRARGKVMVLAGSHPNRHRIMVPVDLSDATGLILAFLQQTYVGKPGVVLHFVHVARRPDPSVEKKWQAWLNLVEMGDAPPLEVVAAAGGVAECLLALVQRGAFGTVIMGKRGLSGIKKWMLGSVSQGVLNGLRDQTLFLID